MAKGAGSSAKTHPFRFGTWGGAYARLLFQPAPGLIGFLSTEGLLGAEIYGSGIEASWANTVLVLVVGTYLES
jgi:hypothetical protein